MMMNLFSVMLALVMSSTTTVNLSDFLVISHRGLPSEAPAHTFEGYDLAIEQGSVYIEQDVVLSKDGHLIVSHNDRIAKGKKISELSLDEIKEFRSENDEPFYTLEEVFLRYGKTVNYVIENKVSDDEFLAEQAMVDLVKKYELIDNVVFQSFYAESLVYFQKVTPTVPRIMLVQKRRNVDFLKKYEKYNYVDVVALESKLLDEERVSILQEAGFKVFAYFLSEPLKESKRVVELGLDGVFTDYTGRTFELLKGLH